MHTHPQHLSPKVRGHLHMALPAPPSPWPAPPPAPLPPAQLLVATSTLAWGVNTPAHLVIIKGTEFYDAPAKRYTDFPITDVLQVRG